ncbi:hypothetical protein NW739_02880 [Mycoplasmopsis felis]|nr:hypothetical protein [Mycoplasmopsis felis]MCU9939703.1 hypothetical protein [Mycoplasmopsis felis]
MMVLQSKIFPPIHKLSQSGSQGRIKINIITRFVTLIIAFPQAIMLTRTLSTGDSIFIRVVGTSYFSESILIYFIIPLILVAASLLRLFISEQITNKGVGNGISLIIFAGIANRLPFQFQSALSYYIGDYNDNTLLKGVVSFFSYVIIYVFIIFIIAIVYIAERHIPIQQVGEGRSKNRKEMGKLPIKANPGGIIAYNFCDDGIIFPFYDR